ncbi:hypothetical protein [Streptomyces syringium]
MMELTADDFRNVLLDLYLIQREAGHLRAELEQARARITELEAVRREAG